MAIMPSEGSLCQFEGEAVLEIIPLIGDFFIHSLAMRGQSAWIAGIVEPSSDKDASRSYLVSDDKG